MEKNCVEKWNIKGVVRVSPLHKAFPGSPKTPEKYRRPFMKISGLFCLYGAFSP